MFFVLSERSNKENCMMDGYNQRTYIYDPSGELALMIDRCLCDSAINDSYVEFRSSLVEAENAVEAYAKFTDWLSCGFEKSFLAEKSQQILANEIEKLSYSMGILYNLEKETESFVDRILSKGYLSPEDICFIFKKLLNKRFTPHDIFEAEEDIIMLAKDGMSAKDILTSIRYSYFDRD